MHDCTFKGTSRGRLFIMWLPRATWFLLIRAATQEKKTRDTVKTARGLVMEEVDLESLEDIDINELTDINEIKKFHGCFLRKEVSLLNYFVTRAVSEVALSILFF